jgi:DGQHR domain-containing protein
VLRQDSWRDPEGLYQRVLIPAKIRSMRKYLLDVKRVFVNNIIVTLPPTTKLNDPASPGTNIDAKALTKVAPVSIQIPYTSNAIGLVDGQHRVFCYYESADRVELKIAALRKRQNLLVTGLIFPARWTEEERRRFEARLFLEINDTQARAKSGLKQSIEVVLNPLSTTAIAKEITNRLARTGPLKDLVQISVFDPPGRIKTTSIVSYGLKPLVKREGPDSLFHTWSHPDKERLAQLTDIGSDRPLLDHYIQYCVSTINTFLGAARSKLSSEKWIINEDKKTKGQWLTPTTINGLFVCMRQMAAHGHMRTYDYYARRLTGIDAFSIKNFRSSHWNALGQKLFQQFFT